ncbi:Amino acid permease domain [Sesbania bispinosa]|nr:Amino acid permease domain [Sesbania bispinosa]
MKELPYLVRCGDGEQTTGEDDGSSVAVTEAKIEQRRSQGGRARTDADVKRLGFFSVRNEYGVSSLLILFGFLIARTK